MSLFVLPTPKILALSILRVLTNTKAWFNIVSVFKAKTGFRYLSTMGIYCIALGDSMCRGSSLRVVAEASSTISDIRAWIAIIVESVGVAMIFKKGSCKFPILIPTLKWLLLPPAVIVFIVRTTRHMC